MGYRIKTVAEMLGVPRNTLLAWERRYGIVQPARQANGYREYSDADVDRLRELKNLVDSGHRVGEAISLMQDARAAQVSNPDAELAETVRGEALDALLRLDRRRAEELIRRCAAMSYERKIDRIYFPMLRRVGELWAEDELSVAQEHFVSNFCREQLTAMLISLDHGPAAGKLTLCAAFPGELHELALLGISVKLAMRNHRIVFLGAQTPLGDLIGMINQHKPELVCLSLTIPRAVGDIVAQARELVQNIRVKPRLVVGGAGLPHDDLPEIQGITWAQSDDDLFH
ncbi:MAG: MerR family transcriptional regulator [Myxococcota bacterium]